MVIKSLKYNIMNKKANKFSISTAKLLLGNFRKTKNLNFKQLYKAIYIS